MARAVSECQLCVLRLPSPAYLLFCDAALLPVAPTSTTSQTHLDCPRFLLENDISILMQNACKSSVFFTMLTSPRVWVGAGRRALCEQGAAGEELAGAARSMGWGLGLAAATSTRGARF